MSHFYGTVEGSAKTIATRTGTISSGIQTFCASYAGAIKCSVYRKDGVDYGRVEKKPWRGFGESRLLYDGPLGEDPQDTPSASSPPLP